MENKPEIRTEEELEKLIKATAAQASKMKLDGEQTAQVMETFKALYQLYQQDQKIALEKQKLDQAMVSEVHDNARKQDELAFRRQQHCDEVKLRREQQQAEAEYKQQQLKLEEDRAALELAAKEKLARLEQEKLKNGKLEQLIRGVGVAVSTAFNVWVTKEVMAFESTGVVGSFVAKKLFGSLIGKQKTDV